MTELRNLRLYGSLANDFGEVHEVAADTLPAALRIVDCNHPGFLSRVRRGSFHCLFGSSEIEEAREMETHHLPLPRSKGDFHLVPAAEGGKGRTGKIIFSIVVGGALLATGIGGALGATAATVEAGAATGFAASTGFLGISYGTVALMGAGLLLGGLNQLLTPVPKVNTDQRDPTAFTFGGPAAVDTEGGPIPLVYGEVIYGGVVVASSIRNNYGGSSGGTASGDFGLNYGGNMSAFGIFRVSAF